MLVYFILIWNILLPFDIFYGDLVLCVVIWYISPRFGMLYQEKSGNPGRSHKVHRTVEDNFMVQFLVINESEY
jgi:hypothetical protein